MLTPMQNLKGTIIARAACHRAAKKLTQKYTKERQDSVIRSLREVGYVALPQEDKDVIHWMES